jgi:hypothetical protein
MLYMISSVASWWEFVMFLLLYYNPRIVSWFAWLFHLYGSRRMTQNKCDTVNHECTVNNRKMNINHLLIKTYILIIIMRKTVLLKLFICNRILYIHFWMILYGSLAFNYIQMETSEIVILIPKFQLWRIPGIHSDTERYVNVVWTLKL